MINRLYKHTIQLFENDCGTAVGSEYSKIFRVRSELCRGKKVIICIITILIIKMFYSRMLYNSY